MPLGYFEHINMPGLWYHESCPISFTLIVNNFGVKYVNKDDVHHVFASIKKIYTLTKDWTGYLYWGIALSWDYINRTVDISMPGYIKKKIQEYNHIIEKHNQTCPYAPAPKQFGTEVQALPPTDYYPCLDKAGIWRVQIIVGSILYYTRAVNMTILMALSTTVSKQTKASEKNWKNVHNCWITLHCTWMQKNVIMLWTWWWTFTKMTHICQKQTHAATHAAIFSWDGFLQMANQ